MAAASLGGSSFFPQAASVNAALHEISSKTLLGDFFAGAANMASPFFYG
jgi:hypothetical protein